MKKLLLAVMAMAAVSGCGQKSTPVADDAAGATPAASSAPAPGTPTAAPTAAEIDQAATAAQESDGTAAAPADASLERLVAMPESAQLPGGRWTAGTHYRPLSPSQPTRVGPGEVEVIEFMWLACSGCYMVNERVTAWKARQPAWVKFRQEHVMWGPSHRSLARLLYTLDTLGRGDVIPKAFEEIHRRSNMLVDLKGSDERTLQIQLAFAKANGISEADFRREYNGFAVKTRLQHADELNRRYKVDQTPVFIVNGKYWIDLKMGGADTRLIPMLDDLVAFEKK